MKLTGEDQKLFANWVRNHCSGFSCSMCHSNQWKIGDLIRSVDSALDNFGGAQPAMIQLICKSCYHTVLFDARGIPGWSETGPGAEPPNR